MTVVDVEAVTGLVARVAYDLVLPRFRDLDRDEVSEKAPGDLVTVVDTAAEEAIIAGLAELAPGIPVVGEEGASADPGLLTALPELDQVFVVDPIDGTRPFVEGRPDYAVMVALVARGEPVAGWICLPSREEIVVGERGSGAWRNGERMVAPDRPSEPRLRVAPTRGYDTELAGRADAAGLVVGLGTPLWAGRSYVALATGEVDGLGYWVSWPWDHAPGTAIVRELGGEVALLGGGDYRAVGQVGPMLAAGDRTVADRLRGLMSPDPRR